MENHYIHRWIYDDEGYYCYLLISATEEIFDKTLLALAEQGIFVYHHGRSYRPACDGFQYDWFIRIDKKEISKKQIELLFKTKELILPQKDQEDLISRNVLEKLEKELNTVKSNYERLKASFDIVNAENKEKERAIKRSAIEFKTLEKENTDFLKECRRQEKVIETYKDNYIELLNKVRPLQSEVEKKKIYDTSIYEAYRKEIDSLKNKNKDLINNNIEAKKDFNNQIDDFIRTYTNEMDSYKGRLAKCEYENKTLVERIESLIETPGSSTFNNTKKNRQSWEETIKGLFLHFMPSKILLKDTFTKIIVEYKDIHKVVEMIDGIGTPSKNGDPKPVQGTKNRWTELTLDPDWRIYYSKRQDQWWVYLGVKKEQPRDIKYIKAL